MDSDWQSDLNSWQARHRYILKNGLRADCCFLTGVVPEDRRVFQAHKLLLASASAVFERMFFGSLPEKGDDPIEVPDIEADDFEDLLLFIYTDEIQIYGLEQAQRMYSAADKYMLIPLKKTCIEFLFKKVAFFNACQIFEFSKRFEEKSLEEECKDIIRKSVGAVHYVFEASFWKADISTVDFILDQDQLNINSELQLFAALEKYAINRFPIDKRVDCNSIRETCNPKQSDDSTSEEEKNEKTQDTLCQTIEPIEKMLKLFKKIRFLTLTVDEFVEGPAASKYISKSDALDMLLCIMEKRKIEDHFPNGFSVSKKRRNSIYQ